MQRRPIQTPVCHKFFTVWKQTAHKASKVSDAKLFASCLDECFLFHVINKTLLFKLVYCYLEVFFSCLCFCILWGKCFERPAYFKPVTIHTNITMLTPRVQNKTAVHYTCQIFLIIRFFHKQHFFSTQPQCCLNFWWIEVQMLLRWCLLLISIIILRHFLYLVYYVHV